MVHGVSEVFAACAISPVIVTAPTPRRLSPQPLFAEAMPGRRASTNTDPAAFA
jgi:hypothetical protein